ncbi:hypothetical protein B0T12DRAFT_494309 [Alternaria alternata]|nr:hypothetical protein B0T12DRAFT_494309 [Alternaria alternata]
MKLFYYALLSAATPLALSLGVPSASSEQVNQLAARADIDAADSSLVDGALPKRNLAKRDITGITRQCYGTNGKFNVPVILRPTENSSGDHLGHRFVGEAYIYGKIDDEAFGVHCQEETFKLL